MFSWYLVNTAFDLMAGYCTLCQCIGMLWFYNRYWKVMASFRKIDAPHAFCMHDMRSLAWCFLTVKTLRERSQEWWEILTNWKPVFEHGLFVSPSFSWFLCFAWIQDLSNRAKPKPMAPFFGISRVSTRQFCAIWRLPRFGCVMQKIVLLLDFFVCLIWWVWND